MKPFSIRESIPKPETCLFLFLCLVQLVPVWFSAVFISGDAPAHLYNSRIISSLLLDSDSPFQQFFGVDIFPIPNLLGHFLLICFNTVCNPIVSEKLVFSIAILLFPLSFRLLISKQNTVISYLALPFGFSFLTSIGFQSFCLAFGLLFLAMYVWNLLLDRLSIARIIAFIITCTLLYFGHLLPFLIFNLYLFVYLAVYALQKKALPKTSLLVLFLMISAGSLLGLYITRNDVQTTIIKKYLDVSLLAEHIVVANPLITLGVTNEALFGKVLAGFCVLILAFALFQNFRKRGDKPNTKSTFFIATAITFVALFLAYFIAPDWSGSAGFISMRLCLMVWVFFLLMLSFWLSPNKIISGLVMAFVAVVVLYRTDTIYKDYKFLGGDAALFVQASKIIPDGKVVLPLNYSCHWLDFNFGSYLGITNKVILLDNYEAEKEHFPTKWKSGMFPGNRIGNVSSSNRPRLDYSKYETETGVKIDYISRHCWSKDYTDSATVHTNRLIDSCFTPVLILENGRLEVFKRK